jgi:hypothetical protein
MSGDQIERSYIRTLPFAKMSLSVGDLSGAENQVALEFEMA